MSITKPSIPALPQPGMPRLNFDNAVKETLETIAGRRGNKVRPLAATSTQAEIIDKINELLDLLQ